MRACRLPYGASAVVSATISGKYATVTLGLVELDPATQPRAELSRETVEQYAEHMREGAEFPPVTLYDDGQHYWLANGHHRVHAARAIGREHVRAEIRRAAGRTRSSSAWARTPPCRGPMPTSAGPLLSRWGCPSWPGNPTARSRPRARSRTPSSPPSAASYLATVARCRRRARSRAAAPPTPWPRVPSGAQRSRPSRTSPGRVPRSGGAKRRRPDEVTTATAPPAAPATVRRPEPHKAVSLRRWRELDEDARARLLRPTPGRSRPTFNRQGNNSIGWATWSWNPVTGCEHACPYCYARVIAKSERLARSYPNGFEPTFPPRRLLAPRFTPQRDAADRLAQRNVFVCSMADLFGRWVPEEWIRGRARRLRRGAGVDVPVPDQVPEAPGRVRPAGERLVRHHRRSAGAGARAPRRRSRRSSTGRPGSRSSRCSSRCEFARLDLFDWVVVGGASAQPATDESPATPDWRPPFEWVADLHRQARAAGCRNLAQGQPARVGRARDDGRPAGAAAAAAGARGLPLPRTTAVSARLHPGAPPDRETIRELKARLDLPSVVAGHVALEASRPARALGLLLLPRRPYPQLQGRHSPRHLPLLRLRRPRRRDRLPGRGRGPGHWPTPSGGCASSRRWRAYARPPPRRPAAGGPDPEAEARRELAQEIWRQTVDIRPGTDALALPDASAAASAGGTPTASAGTRTARGARATRRLHRGPGQRPRDRPRRRPSGASGPRSRARCERWGLGPMKGNAARLFHAPRPAARGRRGRRGRAGRARADRPAGLGGALGRQHGRADPARALPRGADPRGPRRERRRARRTPTSWPPGCGPRAGTPRSGARSAGKDANDVLLLGRGGG